MILSNVLKLLGFCHLLFLLNPQSSKGLDETQIENSSYLVVSTKSGKVKGFTQKLPRGQVQTFYGIPYAKPPILKLRFKKPEKISAWSGVKEALRKPSACYQDYDYSFNRIPGMLSDISEKLKIRNSNKSNSLLYFYVYI